MYVYVCECICAYMYIMFFGMHARIYVCVCLFVCESFYVCGHACTVGMQES